MEIIFIILILIIIVLGIVLLCRIQQSKSLLLNNFSRCNVIVFGKKGTGKDLVFQKVINWRKKHYYSNIDYGGFCHLATPSYLELGSNTYNNFILGNVEVMNKDRYPFENKDFYFSDCGIILPSQYDSLLHKTYKSFPVSYALSRHLWSNNIHANTQALSRIWLPLREQADFYIKCNKTLNIFGYLITFFYTYDKYESALAGLSPLSPRMLNNYSKAEYDTYIATNGEIHSGFIIQRAKKVKYDTRAYHRIIFGTDIKSGD